MSSTIEPNTLGLISSYERDYILSYFINLRKLHSKTTEEVSIGIGKKKSYIGQVERKKIEFNFNLLCRLREYFEELGVSTDEIKLAIDKRSIYYTYVKAAHIGSKFGPKKINRIKKSLNEIDDTNEYYSLTDCSDIESQRINTKFQLLLVIFKDTNDVRPHYHNGEEFAYPLTGDVQLKLMKDKQIKVGPTSENKYAWFKSTLVHQYQRLNKKEDAKIFNILKDPRGSLGIFRYEEEDKSDEEQVQFFENWEQFEKTKNVNLVKNEIGFTLKHARLRAGISIKSLANEINENPQYIAKIENNEGKPNLKIIIGIAKALRIPISDILLSSHPKFKFGKFENEKNLTGKGSKLNIQFKEFYKNSDPMNFVKADNDIAFFCLEGLIRIYMVREFPENAKLPITVKETLDNHPDKLDYKMLDPWDVIYLKEGSYYTFDKRYSECSKIMQIRTIEK